jgi:hypothetical protein
MFKCNLLSVLQSAVPPLSIFRLVIIRLGALVFNFACSLGRFLAGGGFLAVNIHVLLLLYLWQFFPVLNLTLEKLKRSSHSFGNHRRDFLSRMRSCVLCPLATRSQSSDQ